MDKDGFWLASERLSARRPTADDLAAVWRIHSDPETYRHHPAGCPHHREEAAGLLDHWVEHWQRWGFGYAVIRTLGSPDAIGFAGLRWQRLGGPVLNLYYRFAPAAWGHGHATEIAAAIVAWARTTHPATPVIARIALNNPASMRVAERIGMAVTTVIDPGDDVPHVIYATRSLVPDGRNE
jgi:[ribosomal protein S5]-alanine N-acetyltransferase